MQPPSSLRGLVVLVVEDNPNVLEATSYLIEAAFGCHILGASSCAEALALIDLGKRVDLVFSEAVLPGKDGLTLGRLARERMPSLPVVLATEWTDEIDSILDRGYVPLLKPYSVQRLEDVFIALLCKKRGEPHHGEYGKESTPAMSSLTSRPLEAQKTWHVNRR